MTDTNRVIIHGRLTKDVNVEYLGNGTAKGSLSIAVNRSIKRGEEWVEEVSYFDAVVWGKSAENLKPYLLKGKSILIDGYLKQDRWEKDGEKKSRIVINVESLQLTGGKAEGSNSQAQANNNYKPKQSAPANNGAAYAEDIPF